MILLLFENRMHCHFFIQCNKFMNLKFAEKLSCVLIGLGGGGLPNFLHQHIPQVKKLDETGTLVFHKFQEIDTSTLVSVAVQIHVIFGFYHLPEYM